jgi:microcystin-dependent protein
MASVLLSSVGVGQQFFDNNGVPLAGGLIYTYQAGSSTALLTYQDNGGTIANANPIVLDSSGRVPAEIWMLTGYSYKFVIQSASATTLITLDNLYGILQNAPAVSSTIPSGLIAIWSGSTGSIPSGWVICDGSNGTPDLRNSFILGAGNTYAVGATGGTTTTTLTQSNLPNVNFTVTDPGHAHTFQGSIYNNPATTGGGSAAGGTTLTTNTAVTGITVNSGGSGTAFNILPPYYALAYIMKS